MLHLLPFDVFKIVLDFLPTIQDIWAVSETSQFLYRRTLYRLYDTLTFSTRNEPGPHQLDVESFTSTRSERRLKIHLQRVRNLGFDMAPESGLPNRCGYRTFLPFDYRVGEPVGVHINSVHGGYALDLLNQILPILKGLQNNQLISFSWHLHTCLPPLVLDHDGYITLRQANIAHLSLRTDDRCLHTGIRLEGLKKLQSLRSLSWHSIATTLEMETLCECIHLNARRLLELDIGFNKARSPEIPHSFTKAICESMLNRLSLVNCRLDRMLEIRFLPRSLRSLTLRDCPHQLELLQSLTSSITPVELDSFEISFDDLTHTKRSKDHPVVAFLLSFQTLRHLHLLVTNPIPAEGEFLQVIRHHPGLRCLVYHGRQDQPVAEFPDLYETHDITFNSSYLSQLLANSSLKNLGLCLPPLITRCLLEHSAQTLKVEVLHLRATSCRCLSHGPRLSPQLSPERSSELYQSNSQGWEVIQGRQAGSLWGGRSSPTGLYSFADWAFGPQGLKKLKVLAYGNFENESHQSIILQRTPHASKKKYRTGNLKDPETWFDTEEGPETLRSCPISKH